MFKYQEVIKDINDLNGDYWIKANAGCGKTTKLVGRFIFLLENGVKPEDILCITYTNASANEMKERIKKTLEQEDIKQIFKNKKIIVDINKLQISTIHSFCYGFLQDKNLLSKHTSILNQNKRMMNKIIDKVIDNISKDSRLEKYIKIISKNLSILDYYKLIKTIIEAQNNFRQLCPKVFDFENKKEMSEEYELNYLLPKQLQELKNFDIISIKCKILNEIKNIKKEILYEFTAGKVRDLYNIDDWYSFVMTTNNEPRKKKPKTNEIVLEKLFSDIQEYFIKKNNIACYKISEAILYIVKEVLRIYDIIKNNSNVITYDDILYETKKIANNGGLTKIKYIMLDEAQDTNPISFDIISHFIDKQGNYSKIFVVGDRKQSIYSFQGANLYYYNKYYNIFKNRSQKGCWHDDVNLNLSYRSKKEILKFVDEFCNNNIEAFDIVTEEIQDLIIEHKTAIQGDGRVEKEYFPVEEDKQSKSEIIDWIENTQNEIKKQQIINKKANELSNKIYEICKTGKTTAIIVPEKNTKNGFAFDVIGYLQEKININLSPELAIKSIYFKDIIAIIKFFVLQNDDINLACVLKSNFFNFTDDELQNLISNKKYTLWENLLSKEWQTKTKKAIFFLKEILLKNNICEIVEAIKNTCAISDIYNVYINILELIITSYIEEDNNIYDIRMFIQYIEEGQFNIKKYIPNVSEGVFFSTIHGVKGLEFDNVILLDFSSKPSSGAKNTSFYEKMLFIESEDNNYFFFKQPKTFAIKEIDDEIERKKNNLLNEKKRLYYVAITRAKNSFFYYYSGEDFLKE